jgi:hypothetical protein
MFNLHFSEEARDGTNYTVNTYISFTSDGGLASSNFVFTYDPTSLSNPVLVTGSTNLTQTPFPVYDLSVTEPVTGRVSVNVVLNASGFGDEITSAPFLLAQIRFDIDDTASEPRLDWVYDGDGATTGTVVFQDDGSNATTQLNAGALIGMDNFLPVELISFTARSFENKVVVLNWKTASEQNNEYFTVERSTDARNFEEIETIEGAGTTSIPQYYQSIDERPYRGVNYYRLKQTDFDGTTSWSEIQSVTFGEASNRSVRVFPNPGAAVFHIDSKYEAFTVKLFNQLGQQVLLAQNARNLDVSQLPMGTYFMKVEDRVSTAFETVKVMVVK